MKKKKKRETKEIIKYGLGITALCLCWLTFKHTNTLELVVGIISLAYLIILAMPCSHCKRNCKDYWRKKNEN